MSPSAAGSPRWFVVVNPAAGRGRAAQQRARIEAALRGERIDFELATSDYPGHALPLVAQALDAGLRDIIAVGGDGTMHEVVNAILRHPAATATTLAPVPVGTGNDWCRSLRVQADYAAIAARCARRAVRAIDLGEARCADGGVRYFANVAGAGFDAYVLERMADRRFGPASYLIAVMRGLTGYRPAPMRVRSGAQSYEGRAFVTFVCLGAYCGGGMHVAPAADLGDGLFDIVHIGDLGRLDVLVSLRRLFDGTIAAHRKVRTLRGAQVVIDSPHPLAVEADGELIGSTPVTLSVRPRALQVVAAGPA